MDENKQAVLIEKARRIMKGTINHILIETKLPAHSLEGVLLDMLAETRGQMITELYAEMSAQKEGNTDE